MERLKNKNRKLYYFTKKSLYTLAFAGVVAAMLRKK
jgi:hypothetical protein